ncbi:TetR/AcrR family transcriptional regulator [Fluviicoccus keumensis]|nr:TetR/AcrR family transcriptional regulator [Fluviicoccus keumensis]
MTALKSKWGDREARREDILAAARTCLAEQGLQALNIRDIARMAQLSPGTVYTYFASKEELYATLYAERMEALLEELRPVCAAAPDLESLFIAIAELYLPMYRLYGRELNVWSRQRVAGREPTALELRLLSASRNLFAPVFSAALRLSADEQLIRAYQARPGEVMALCWICLTGLAEHYSGDRGQMHGQTYEAVARLTIRTLLAGLKSLTPPEDPTNTNQG